MSNAKALLEDLAAAVMPTDYSQEEMEMDVSDGRERLTQLVQDALGATTNIGEISVAVLLDAATPMPSSMWTKKILSAVEEAIRAGGGSVDKTYTISWQQTAMHIKVPGFSSMSIYKKLDTEGDRVLPQEKPQLAPASLLLSGLLELPGRSMVDLVFIVSNFNLGDDPGDLKSELRLYRDKTIYIYVGSGTTPHSEVLDACHPGWRRQMVRAKSLLK